MQLTAKQLTLRGRQGIYTRLANEDPREMTQPARRGFLVRFDRIVMEKWGVLPPAEHERRAQAELCAYMAGLRLKKSLKDAAQKTANKARKAGGERAA